MRIDKFLHAKAPQVPFDFGPNAQIDGVNRRPVPGSGTQVISVQFTGQE